MNSKKSYQLLEQALRALPSETAFSEARSQIRKALTEIAEAEKKKSNKRTQGLTPAEKWKLDLETATLSSPYTQRLQPTQVNPLDAIDNLIKSEQRKIDEIKKQQKPQDTIGGLFTG